MERGISGVRAAEAAYHSGVFSWLARQKLSQVGTGDQVLGDCGQRTELNAERVYSRKREREQIY